MTTVERQMWDCYYAILKAMENHNIDAKHDSPNRTTTFYFRDCCGGDIVKEALNYLKLG